jgi:hypothetical protein
MSVLSKFWFAREKWLINWNYCHNYQMCMTCFTYLSLRSAYEFQKSRYRGNNFISEETYHTTRGHLSYNERSIRILDTTERVTHSKVIKMCKVQWSHHSEDEATWEHEEERISDYPELFPSASESRG